MAAVTPFSRAFLSFDVFDLRGKSKTRDTIGINEVKN